MELRGGSENLKDLIEEAEEVFEEDEEDNIMREYSTSECDEIISYGSESIDCKIYECMNREGTDEVKARRLVDTFYDMVIRRRHFKYIHKFLIQGIDLNREMTSEDLSKTVADSKFGHLIRTKCTVLHLAAALGYNRTCARLIDLGAEVHAAVWLVYHGSLADVNHATTNGLTPLHYAATSGYVGATFRLLQLGADVYKRTSDGKTAYDVDGCCEFAGPTLTCSQIAFRQGSKHVCYLLQCWILQYGMDLRAARSETAGGVFYHGAGNFSIPPCIRSPAHATAEAFIKSLSACPADNLPNAPAAVEQPVHPHVSRPSFQPRPGVLVPYKIIMKRLPYSMQEEELKALFQTNSLPEPKKISFLRNPDKTHFSMAFVEMQNEEQASRAIAALNNIIVNDPDDPRWPKRLEVSKCYDVRKKPPEQGVLQETVDYEGRRVDPSRRPNQAGRGGFGRGSTSSQHRPSPGGRLNSWWRS
ncbi:hypothetical protein GUITHDRAFT_117230 [Guillardia theta CCMP2712]|uniref:RRM domain-containing protein n=1 Tax=Guillardia theta (strain CCMP2712) TaxID=905079 RepID=L1ILA0_GUITC|nr:hypothetical protein GUITHDRAFT_117230 [Guillardia theta CCMP2712]EKX36575.1 hypothetical protein GUITHDRAFT_117230 [Guillardia theta CCMP2712]|eukprot:XP_005823555.1 hypothetical protein GUITHDRAFT_117230 [Guillardia theta CCMP2712]